MKRQVVYLRQRDCRWAWRRLPPTSCEQALRMPARADVPLEVPEGTPVIADNGHD